jgi:hypothetical protein
MWGEKYVGGALAPNMIKESRLKPLPQSRSHKPLPQSRSHNQF